MLFVAHLVSLVPFATQDIILCDWFAELPAAAKLRCTYSYMASQQRIPPGQDQLPPGPAFALDRHHELLGLLMQLYVILTRATRSLIIIERRCALAVCLSFTFRDVIVDVLMHRQRLECTCLPISVTWARCVSTNAAFRYPVVKR